MEDFISECREGFATEFGDSNNSIGSAAPGRVNLIGEHTDYNEGFVFPMCLPMYTVCVGKANNSDMINIYSRTMKQKSCFPTAAISKTDSESESWSNYIRGVCFLFADKYGKSLPGFDLYLDTKVPLGGGLSSSASLEVAVATFLEELTGFKLETREKALLSQSAEHKFAGVPCGIMDQWISAHGIKGSALILDCRTCTHELVPINSTELVFLVTNSNVKHALVGGEYSKRRDSCYSASEKLGAKSLREVTMEQVKENASKLTEIELKRARHVVGENDRTTGAAKALQANQFEAFGTLMNESHNSLRDDYEVSCPELDELVEIARSVPGVLGSRMTGGGFGGCTVTLVRADAVETLKEKINSKYSGKATFYTATASQGAHTIKL